MNLQSNFCHAIDCFGIFLISVSEKPGCIRLKASQLGFFLFKIWSEKMEEQTITFGNHIDRYLSDREICQALGKSRPTLWRWRREGKFPLPHRLGENSNGTLLSVFKKWQEEKAIQAGGL